MEYPSCISFSSLFCLNIPSPDPVEWDSRQLERVSTSSICLSSSRVKQGQSSTTAFAKARSASDAMFFKEGIFVKVVLGGSAIRREV